MKTLQRTVLVTGASSGIGLAIAKLLAKVGFRVIAGVRCQMRSEELVHECGENIAPVLLDVTCADQVAAAVEQARRASGDGLFALVNNAGVAPPSAMELSDLDEVRHIFEVNAVGTLRMIQACLPLLRHGGGRVINMSSMNGTLALPMVGVYSASKFAVEAISDTLRIELRPWNIPVSVIRPGQVRTAIFSKARAVLERRSGEIPPELIHGYQELYSRSTDFNERGASSNTKPEAVARVALKILRARKPKARYVVGLDAHGLSIARAILPQRTFESIVARLAGSTRSVVDSALPHYSGAPAVASSSATAPR